jgi:branched-subunit amino acid transport protein
MNLRRILTFVVIILLFAIFRPTGFWKELQRLWEQRETITRLLFFLVVAYLSYGLYELYQEGWFDRWLRMLGF